MLGGGYILCEIMVLHDRLLMHQRSTQTLDRNCVAQWAEPLFNNHFNQSGHW
jgi:hypothetical protein